MFSYCNLGLNEAENIPALIERIGRARPPGPFQVLVVDDGSWDGTGEAASQAAREAGLSLAVLRHPSNLGLAAGLRDGLRWATARAKSDDVIVCMDADNTQDPALIPEMVARIDQGSDVVIASRYRRGAWVRGVPAYRRILSDGVNVLLRLTLPIRGVRDYTSGFRAYRASLLQRAFERFGDRIVQARTFACTAELLLNVKSLGARVSEVPIRLRYDDRQGTSKMRVAATVAEYLKLIPRMAMREPRFSRRWLWAVALAVFLVPIGAPLTDGDSAYYGTIAEQILRTGDWVTLRHPAHPEAIVDKPPLTMWLMAASFRLLGAGEVAARLWQVAMGLAVLWLTMDIGRMYLSERAATRGGWILLSCALFWYSVLVPQQDVAALFFVEAAFWALLRFLQQGRLWAFYLVWPALAGALLTRGITTVAFAGLVVVTFAALARVVPSKAFGSTGRAAGHLAAGVALFLALGAPWFVVEARRLGPDFIEVFFTSGNARFFSGRPAAAGLALVLGYVPLLAAAFLPWSGWIPQAVGNAIRRLRRSREPAVTKDGNGVRLFVVVWAIAAFAVPHLIAWRVIRYLLPVLPPLALLVAEDLEAQGTEAASASCRRPVWYWATLALFAPFVAAAVALPWVQLPTEGEGLRPVAGLLLGVLAGGALVFALFGRRCEGRAVRTLLGTALAAWLAAGGGLALAGKRAFPQRDLAGMVTALAGPSDAVVLDSVTPDVFYHFYLPGRVPVAPSIDAAVGAARARGEGVVWWVTTREAAQALSRSRPDLTVKLVATTLPGDVLACVEKGRPRATRPGPATPNSQAKAVSFRP